MLDTERGADQGAAPAPPAAAADALDLTIVVPVRTGEARIGELVEALGGELDRIGRSWELVPVFDGVRGAAFAEAERLAREAPGRVRPISFQQPFGESACLSAALELARGRVILTSPHYVQVDPSELGGMLRAIDEGADFAAPWRHGRVDPLLNRVESACFNFLMRRILKAPFHDLNCHFRAIRREVLESLSIYGDMYRFLPAIAWRQGFKVVELPVRHVQEWGGAGFFGVGVYVRRLLDLLGVVFLAHFTLKPLRFFGTLGALFLLLGGLMSTGLVLQYLFAPENGLYSRPLFLIGVLLMVLGVQIIGFGLVGEIIIYTQARNLQQYRVERIYEK